MTAYSHGVVMKIVISLLAAAGLAVLILHTLSGEGAEPSGKFDFAVTEFIIAPSPHRPVSGK